MTRGVPSGGKFRCRACGMWFQYDGTYSEAVRAALELGWHMPDGKFTCVNCARYAEMVAGRAVSE